MASVQCVLHGTHKHDAIEVSQGAREEVPRHPQTVGKDEAIDSPQQLCRTPWTYTRACTDHVLVCNTHYVPTHTLALTTAAMSPTSSHDNQLSQEQIVNMLVLGNVMKHNIRPQTWIGTAAKY